MQLKSASTKWTKIASLLLIGGALAWTIKLGVIISTNGRIIDTGAAALFMKIGLIMLAAGSTGVGHRLTYNRPMVLRIVAILLSPIVIFGSLILIGSQITPLFKNSSVWYAEQEAPIALAIVFSLAIGYVLLKSYRTAS
jgi:hypothetical protein